MDNGLYRVHFATAAGDGFGVIKAEDGKLVGGDSIVYYFGDYTQDGNVLTAEVEAKTHSRVPGLEPIFGVDHVHIKLQGESTANSADLSGTAVEAPGVAFSAHLTKLTD